MSDGDEFAHERHDDDLGRFACGFESLHERSEGFAAAISHHRGHIERMAQVGVPAFGDVRLATHAAARLVRLWGESTEGDRTFGAGKPLTIAQIGNEPRDGVLPQAWHAVEEIPPATQLIVVINVLFDLLPELLDLVIEERQKAGGVLAPARET